MLGFGGTRMDHTIASFLDDMKPGGVALFSRNIDTPEQTMALIRGVRAHDPAGVPMFVSVDQEGGNVVRVKKHATILPSAMALGAAGDPDLARRIGQSLGRDLRLLGFNMNFAPVLDVASNPDNPVIGIRSFGSNPKLVGDLGAAYAQGIQSEGVLAVAKHFPGHGDTDRDSHYHLPVLAHDRARLDEVELYPFARAFAEGLDAIMTAHIALPALTDSGDLPATVSERVLTRLLRDELGYEGLVITDGLEMQGIVQRFGSGDAAVRAVLAGADMVMVLWYPEKKREVRDALLAAVQSGRIPERRLDQAVRRVLVAKARRGVFSTELLPIKTALRELERAPRDVVPEVARRAITLVKNQGNVLPLRRGQLVAVAATEPVFVDELRRTLHARGVVMPVGTTRERVDADAARLVELAAGADVVVVGMQSVEHRAVVERVRSAYPDVPIVVVSFGAPYVLSHLPRVEGYLCAFGWRDESERAAAAALTARTPAAGTMPVELTGGPRLGAR
ncbi:MAG: hypothetical protein A2138_01360 [Deltaproteobacteria bacterium RBG_16_71_12]|nr:MAG: hypothetical protein A2138_01360 [Deltaproteobacteria bacterium RBG_16_71_12]